jgi:nucleotide-binding universal stress UspA family protein
MFKKILVLYDFSESGKQALEWTLRMAEPYGSELKILHIVSPNLLRKGREGNSLFAEIVLDLRKQIEKDLRSTSGFDGGRKLKKFHIHVLMGDPAVASLKVIHSESPDLVVVGTHGRTGLSRVFLGSVAEKIIRHSPVPVLVARGRPRWPLQRMLVPIDLAEISEEAIAFAGEFSQRLGTRIDLLSVLPATEAAFYPPEALEAMGLLQTEVLQEGAKIRLEELVKNHPSFPISTHLEEGNPLRKICDTAQRLHSDFILIPTHGRSDIARFFMGSVAEQVVRYAPCPVLSFCPKKAVRIRNEFLDGFALQDEYPELGA